MKTEWFIDEVTSWSSHISWSEEEVARAATLLKKISLANMGEVVEDGDVSPDQARAYAIARALDALQRRCNQYAATMQRDDEPMVNARAERIPSARPMLDFLYKQRFLPRLNINSASYDELEALPAVGPTIAKRIIEYQQHTGTIHSLQDLDSIAGVGRRVIDALSELVCFGDKNEFHFMTPELAAFISVPDFPHLVDLIARTGGGFKAATDEIPSVAPGSVASPSEHVIDELEVVLDQVTASPYPKSQILQGIRASNLQDIHQDKARFDAMLQDQCTDINTGTLLLDRDYFPFVEELIAAAAGSLHIMLFYLSFYNSDTHPTTALVNTLIEKHRQGVDVRVVFDKDAKGDVYKSRLINQEAYQYLTQAGVPVTYDHEDRLMHMKLLVQDNEHVLIGSHNWTAGSLLSYSDASVYLQSHALAQHYEKLFDHYWETYSAH